MGFYQNKFLLLPGVNCNMFRGKSVICFILARGGSKGVPRKNVKILGNKPLIAHSITSAQNSQFVDEIYVSTEDSEIKQISLDYNAKIIDRPVDLAQDNSNYIDAVQHLITNLPSSIKNPIIILLETTLPLRKIDDIDNCINLFDESIDCVVSVSEVKIPPVYMYKENNGFLEKYDSMTATNRQQMEKLFSYNGSILVTSLNFLKNQKKVVFGGKMKYYVQDEKSSFDIDTSTDFEICDFLFNNSDKL